MGERWDISDSMRTTHAYRSQRALEAEADDHAGPALARRAGRVDRNRPIRGQPRRLPASHSVSYRAGTYVGSLVFMSTTDAYAATRPSPPITCTETRVLYEVPRFSDLAMN